MTERHNVDPTEVAKFDQLAATWWDPEGHSGPLHKLNPLRLGYVERHAGGLFGKDALDVGCGGGLLSEAMAKSGARVTGIDMGEEALDVARLHALESGVDVDYLHATVEQHAADYSGRYPVVTCMEMIEHVPDPASVVKGCAELVAPGGHLFLSTINKTPQAFLTTIVGAEYLLKVLPKGTHDFNKYLRPSQIIAWCEAAGLKVVHADGIRYNPLTDTFSLSDSLSVNYLIHAVKPAPGA